MSQLGPGRYNFLFEYCEFRPPKIGIPTPHAPKITADMRSLKSKVRTRKTDGFYSAHVNGNACSSIRGSIQPYFDAEPPRYKYHRRVRPGVLASLKARGMGMGNTSRLTGLFLEGGSGAGGEPGVVAPPNRTEDHVELVCL